MLMFSLLVFYLIITGLWCEEIERMLVPEGQSFSFDCQSDESVYFAHKLNDWSEIQDGELNLSFQYLSKENVLRITSDNTQMKHEGYYACRKPTWTSTAMNSIYQLVLADVKMFYWNYICYNPSDSCARSDDPIDDNLSSFEITERTEVEFFCCALTSGYKNVNIRMNLVGENTRNVEIQRKEEFDGSSVICAQQRTRFIRQMYQNQHTLTCQLFLNNQPYSTLTSAIIIKDAKLPNRFDNPVWNYQPVSEDSRNRPYFPQPSISRPKIVKRKKVGIIVGSIVGGLVFFGLLFGLTCFLCRRKRRTASSKTPTIHAKAYPIAKASMQRRYENERILRDTDNAYEEPTVLSQTSPVFMRC